MGTSREELIAQQKQKEANFKLIEAEFDSAIVKTFQLLPANVRKGKNPRALLGVKAREWTYKTHDEIAADPQYSTYAVSALHDILILLKESGLLYSDWNSKSDFQKGRYGLTTPSLMTAAFLFFSLDNLFFPVVQDGNLVEAIINQPPIVENKGKKKWLVKTTLVSPYKLEGEFLTLLDHESKPLGRRKAKRSWLPHIVDNLSFRLGLIIQDFFEKIADFPETPEQKQFRLKLKIIGYRLSIYHEGYQEDLFNKSEMLADKLDEEAPLTAQFLDEIKEKIADLKQHYDTWLEFSKKLTTYYDENAEKMATRAVQEQDYDATLHVFFARLKRTYERNNTIISEKIDNFQKQYDEKLSEFRLACLFAKIKELADIFDQEALLTEEFLNEIKEKIIDLKQQYDTWFESCNALNGAMRALSALSFINDLQKQYEKKLSEYRTDKKAMYDRQTLSVLNGVMEDLIKDQLKISYQQEITELDRNNINEIRAEIKFLDDYLKERSEIETIKFCDDITQSCNKNRKENLKAILGLIADHPFRLNHGFGTKVNIKGISRRIAAGAAAVYNLIDVIRPMLEANAIMPCEEYFYIKNQIHLALNHKQSKSFGFFGLGSRDYTTANLYKKILAILNDPTVNVEPVYEKDGKKLKQPVVVRPRR